MKGYRWDKIILECEGHFLFGITVTDVFLSKKLKILYNKEDIKERLIYAISNFKRNV